MTEYDDVRLPDGQRHPLAGIPQAVLDTARAALREMSSSPSLAVDSDTDRMLDNHVDAIADSMVNVLRATGWQDSGSELATQLAEARAALKRLADPHAFTSMPPVPDWKDMRAEMRTRRYYARRAWLGDRVDRFAGNTNDATTKEET